MKLIHVINSLGGGGKERRMLQLVKGLLQNDSIQQSIIVFSKRADHKEASNINVPIITIEEKTHSKQFKALKEVLKKEKPDIVHSWCNLPSVMLFLPVLKLRLGFKYIAGFVADANKSKVLSSTNIFAKVSFWAADAIVSNSKAGLVAKGANMKKSYVIYNGFDFNRIPKNLDFKALRRELGIDTKHVIGMFASFYAGKDYLSFFETASRIADSSNDVKFIAVGQGVDFEYYNKYIEDNRITNTKLLGFRTDVEALMQLCDISLLFSNDKVHAEGVSNSIMEAMASGNVVIATNGGGTPEIIQHKENGYIVPPRGVNEAVVYINELLANEELMKRISKQAIKSIKEKFQLSMMVENYISLYKQLKNENNDINSGA